ncbi:MAG: hypothetical protein P8Z79_09825, partial [Sedimentisphaerales bacterium]
RPIMKRLFIMLCVAGVLAAVPLCNVASAAKKAPAKVEICHVNSANDVVYIEGGAAIVFGRVIEVSENAVDAHLAHGDSLVFIPMYEGDREFFEELFGIYLPNADAFFLVW